MNNLKAATNQEDPDQNKKEESSKYINAFVATVLATAVLEFARQIDQCYHFNLSNVILLLLGLLFYVNSLEDLNAVTNQEYQEQIKETESSSLKHMKVIAITIIGIAVLEIGRQIEHATRYRLNLSYILLSLSLGLFFLHARASDKHCGSESCYEPRRSGIFLLQVHQSLCNNCYLHCITTIRQSLGRKGHKDISRRMLL